MRIRTTLLGFAVLVLSAIVGATGATVGTNQARAQIAPVSIAADGDIADGDADAQATADLVVSRNPQDVLVLGDEAYPTGTTQQFNDFYRPTWGRFDSIAFPVPGNHEYDSSPTAAPYFGYFGARAHPPDGYYSFQLGAWHIVAINSEIPSGVGSAQYQWLQNDLAADNASCTLAFWHKPLFASTVNMGKASMADVYAALDAAGADLVLNGHAHHYERFASQDASGNADPQGIVEIISGTGGASLHKTFTTIAPNSVFRTGQSFGALFMTLSDGSYSFDYKWIDGTTRDSGTGTCQDAPPPPPNDCPLVRSIPSGTRPVNGMVEACADPGNYRVKVTAKDAANVKTTLFDQRADLDLTVRQVGTWSLTQPGTYTVTSKLNRGGALVASSTIQVTVT